MTATVAPVSDSPARMALRVDGTVVGLLGIAMIAATVAAPRFSGLPPGVEIAVGAVSIPFLPLAYWLAAKPRVRRSALLFADINAATTVGLLAVGLTGAGGLTPTGRDVALAVALYTAVIGTWQYLAARRLR